MKWLAFLIVVCWCVTRAGAVTIFLQHPERVPSGLDETIAASQASWAQFPFWEPSGRHIPDYEPGLELPLRLMWLVGLPLNVTSILTLQLIVDFGCLLGIGGLAYLVAGRWAGLLAAGIYASSFEVAAAVSLTWYYYWSIPYSLLAAFCLWRYRDVQSHPHAQFYSPLMQHWVRRERSGVWWALAFGLTLGAWCWFRGTALMFMVLIPFLLPKHRLIAFVGFFLALSPAFVHGIRNHRPIFPRNQVWHNLYIGIGQHPNPWGIRFDDQVAFDLAARHRIEAGMFRSLQYEPFMRGQYLQLAAQRPDIILRNWSENVLIGMTAMGAYTFPLPVLRCLWIGVLFGAWLNSFLRRLAAIWIFQNVVIGFVAAPASSYLWETLGLLILIGSAGWTLGCEYVFARLVNAGWYPRPQDPTMPPSVGKRLSGMRTS